MLYSDNQTKHFYVIPASEGYTVKNLEDSNLFRLILNQDNNQKVTSDVIDRKLIKKIKINEVKPTFLRKWTTQAISSNDLKPATTYYIYFYLENMLGFGMQDRWDRVASYTTDIYDNSGTPTTHDTVSTVMSALKDDLNLKLNGAGPIKNDFLVVILDGTLSKDAADVIFGVTATRSQTSWTDGTDSESLTKANGTNSGKKYTLVKHEGSYKATYEYDDVAVDLTVNGNNLEVYENPKSDTFAPLKTLDIRMHTNPYIYNVTMSTGMTTERGIEPWGNQKQILATNTSNKYISSATKVMAMELYFLRNRGDLYDLTKNFGISILNQPQTLTDDATYYTLDIDYAFSDTQGYTYHSDKQLSIACGGSGAFAALQTLRLAILNDDNENAYSASSNVAYSNAENDDD